MSQNLNIFSNPLFFKTYLHLGNHKCFTNPKVHRHLLGTRYIHEVFSITKLRIQIMQLYPIIQQMLVNKTQFLFASINPDFAGLLIEGAHMCKMLISSHRWEHGFLTSNLIRQSIYIAQRQVVCDPSDNY
jgi:ribosomal protein S2